ncbi:MAG TPA: hypothetical protein VH306_15140 [Gaiellaceae bacterium]|jgi:hypothetical protein
MRPSPVLVVLLPIEGEPHVELFAGSWEDEQRLRDWLEHTAVVGTIPDAIGRLLATAWGTAA